MTGARQVVAIWGHRRCVAPAGEGQYAQIVLTIPHTERDHSAEQKEVGEIGKSLRDDEKRQAELLRHEHKHEGCPAEAQAPERPTACHPGPSLPAATSACAGRGSSVTMPRACRTSSAKSTA